MSSLRAPGWTLCLLLAAALFVRAFLPAGMMAERSEHGAIAVKLCSSGGVHVVPLKDDKSAPDDKQRVGAPCAFAGLAGPATPPPPMSEPVPPVSGALAYDEISTPADTLVPARLNPPARGPPLPA